MIKKRLNSWFAINLEQLASVTRDTAMPGRQVDHFVVLHAVSHKLRDTGSHVHTLARCAASAS